VRKVSRGLAVEDGMLTAQQKKHRDCMIRGKPVIARKALRKALAELETPLCFLDFESFSTWMVLLLVRP
jgi:hypothetical protein